MNGTTNQQMIAERDILTEKYLYLMNDTGAPKRIARLVKCRARIAEINAALQSAIF
jgi:hypothetical protein